MLLFNAIMLLANAAPNSFFPHSSDIWLLAMENREESSIPPFAESHSSRKHGSSEIKWPKKKRVHYADSNLEDFDQSSDTEESELSDIDYVPSDDTSTSSVDRSRQLVTITRDSSGNLNTLCWPWSENIYQCVYGSLAQPDYDPTDALFESVSLVGT